MDALFEEDQPGSNPIENSEVARRVDAIKAKIAAKVKVIIDENTAMKTEIKLLRENIAHLEKKASKRKKAAKKLEHHSAEQEKEIQSLRDSLKSSGLSNSNGSLSDSASSTTSSTTNSNTNSLSASSLKTSSHESLSSSNNNNTSSPSASPSIANGSAKARTTTTKMPTLLSVDDSELDESLREAARRGEKGKLEKLISLGVDVNTKDESGYSALHWAAINGRHECLTTLLHAGSDVNMSDHGGWTALHYAAFKGHKDCIYSLVLMPQVDVEAKNSAKKTPAQIATDKKMAQLLKDVKDPDLRLLLEKAKVFWSGNSDPSKSKGGIVLPEEVAKREQELLEKEKLLLEKEQQIKRVEGELKLAEQTVKKKQQEEREQREKLGEKEKSLTQLETQIQKKMETQGEEDISNLGLSTVSWDEIKVVTELGQGTFGTVYRAMWKGDLVAAKKLKCKLEDTELIQAFQKETTILAKLRHPNIVMVMGACCRVPDLVIVTELMKCDMASLIYNPKEKLDWKEKLTMAIDIARGMTFLHNQIPILIHRDLKSHNCLVDEWKRVKISDFGTAITKEKMGTEVVGTAAWMSPERLIGEPSDEKTDVFSYGVVLWELLNRKLPWEGNSNIQIVARVGHAGERLQLPDTTPKGCPAGLISMIKDCWETYPSKRPSFEFLLRQLRDISS